jgi:hypothetical protein
MLFGFNWCDEMEWGWVLVWSDSFGNIIPHTTFYRNKVLFIL